MQPRLSTEPVDKQVDYLWTSLGSGIVSSAALKMAQRSRGLRGDGRGQSYLVVGSGSRIKSEAR